MIHWNSNMLAVVDVETNGLTSGYHEILEICIIPLNHEIKPKEGVSIFNIILRELIMKHLD